MREAKEPFALAHEVLDFFSNFACLAHVLPPLLQTSLSHKTSIRQSYFKLRLFADELFPGVRPCRTESPAPRQR